MTVSNTTSRNQYTATSGQTVFPYSFEIFDKNDVAVLKNGTLLSEGTNYTVSGVGSDSGGNITLTVGATAGDILTIYRDMAYQRLTDYQNSGDFLAQEVNDDFDRLWLAVQQNNEGNDRAIVKPITDSASIDMTLPSAADRANSYLAFDATGAPSVVAAGDPSAPDAITRQDFTGDGSTLVYTLASAPGAAGAGVMIFIDGVQQDKDSYTITGTTLTFSEAPPLNSNINLVQLKATSIGEADSASVTYIPAGIGAVQTSVQSKLRETVSVKDFGAVGDGVTDDTAAIQAALDSGARKIVFSGDSIFLITSVITIPSSVKIIEGSGSSVIRHNTVANAFSISSTNGLTIDDLEFDNTSVVSGYGSIYSLQTNISDLVIKNCKFYGSASSESNGIKLVHETSTLDRCLISNCYFKDLGRMGIELQNNTALTYQINDVVIENCNIDTVGLSANSMGISLTGYGSNVSITDNMFKNCTFAGIENVGFKNVSVTSCKFDSSTRAFSYTGSILMTGCVISGCTQEGYAQNLIRTSDRLKIVDSEIATVSFRDITNCFFNNVYFNSNGNYSVYIEGTCSLNTFDNCWFDSSASTVNFAVVRTSGANCTGTYLRNSFILPFTSGSPIDAINSAELSISYKVKISGSNLKYSNVSPSMAYLGRKLSYGLNRTAGSGVDTTSINVEFPSSPSWVPAIVSVKVCSCNNGGGFNARAEKRYWVRHQGTTNVVIIGSEDIGTPSNITFSTSTSGTTLTISAQNTAGTGPNLYFVWDVEVTQINGSADLS